jgi:GMP synthase (glutamine-hydrolysing) A subunit
LPFPDPDVSPEALPVSDSGPVLVVDLGGQYSQLIARRVREARVYSELVGHRSSADALQVKNPAAVILSGGPASVYAEHAPQVDPGLYGLGVPVLGICYGMQLMAQDLGGRVERGAGEFGKTALRFRGALGEGLSEDQTVWMSHRDSVSAPPEGAVVTGGSDSTPIAAFEAPERKLYGVQFHPEVVHTPHGQEVLKNFLYGVAGARPTWTPAAVIEEQVDRIRAQVGSARVLCALSGGVDSAVAALLVHKAVGDQLTCVFVDHGLLRKDEAAQVVETFEGHLHVPLVHVDASTRFLARLDGVTDPEEKRRIVGEEFIRIFEEEAEKLGAGSVGGEAADARPGSPQDLISFAEGDRVRAVVAWNVRYPTMANHTATHLLHEVLREVLGEHVKQAGSAVRPDKLRFDFTHPEALTPEQRAEVESRVNARVFANLPVRIFETPIAEAQKLGAMMLFGEKYGEVVRVVDIDGWSVELCGGTHVRTTAEIGPFSILSESSVGAGSRRIEAVTAGEAFALLHERAREADVLRGELDRARKESKRPAAQQEVDFTIVDREGDVVLVEAKGVKGGPLRDLSDRLRQQEKADGAIVASADDGRAFLVVNFDDSLVARGLDAVQVVRELGKHIGGGGGGKPTLAEAGGKNPDGIADALAAAKELVGP